MLKNVHVWTYACFSLFIITKKSRHTECETVLLSIHNTYFHRNIRYFTFFILATFNSNYCYLEVKSLVSEHRVLTYATFFFL